MNGNTNTRLIKAPAAKIYAALTTVQALETWQAPHNMKGKVHQFDLREGGGYSMSLYYPDNEDQFTGKTGEKEDRFNVRFKKLISNKQIIEAVQFVTTDPDFMGEMIIDITLEEKHNATEVTFAYSNLPKGIAPKDNEEGTASSLEKLAQYVEH